MIGSNTDMLLLLEAASFAAHRHRDQRRKDIDATPYINHPLEVAKILSQAGVNDRDVLAAALLHDTIEDTETSVADISERFGERVGHLVLEVTDNKSLPKAERKRRQVQNGPKKSDGAKMIKIADKIANLQDLSHSPPDWTQGRIDAYRLWAYEVVLACRGVNSKLDARAKALCEPAAQGADRGGRMNEYCGQIRPRPVNQSGPRGGL